MTAPKWAVSKSVGEWVVMSPGGHAWTGVPSLPAAVDLARSLSAVEAMLAGLSRPALTLVQDPKPPRQCPKHYGFGPVQPTGGRHAHH